jgi:hypothetical protein
MGNQPELKEGQTRYKKFEESVFSSRVIGRSLRQGVLANTLLVIKETNGVSKGEDRCR